MMMLDNEAGVINMASSVPVVCAWRMAREKPFNPTPK